jgi:hypothetical protein
MISTVSTKKLPRDVMDATRRAEKAVHLFKRQLALMTKYLAEEPSLPNRTFNNLVQKCC